ncbi:MAG: hypothetical protein RLZZ352_2736 [Pseudomonadota bacterium]|jgi:ABC-type transport system involved in cytochrome c biogenesis ATPase subunit
MPLPQAATASTHPTRSEPLLHGRQLCFGWPAQPLLFDQLNLDIFPGVTALLGDEGKGKTSLLRLLAGECPPQSGELTLSTPPAPGEKPVFWIDPRTTDFDSQPAAACLEDLRSAYPRWNAELLAELIDGFALAPHLHKPLYMLSAGSKRKVWLSAAMAAGAALTLIDQPFAALDAPSMQLLTELLQEAAHHPSRAWVVADYEAPAGVALAGVIAL